ncbi:MAG: hypothetical protein CSYNP_03388 [Syntrophus sp. SKADARSKE-3]|nr:hypothetical protein [Syntrophus sp. SKADARSKE-3]
MPQKQNSLPRRCHRCKKLIDLDDRIGRREMCPSCGADIHVCLNCRFHDPAAYNACREPQAERVLDKDRANFCDYFDFRAETGQKLMPTAGTPSAKDRLDALFKSQ